MVCQAIFDGLKVLGPFLTSEYRPSYPVALYWDIKYSRTGQSLTKRPINANVASITTVMSSSLLLCR